MATHEQVRDALSALPKKEMVLAACKILREQCWNLMTDERSKRAVESAEGYVNGTVTKDELDKARSAADAAAYAASHAADAALAVAVAAPAAGGADAAAYAAYAAADGSTSDDAKRSELRERQLEIIAEFSKKKDDGLVELLEKALEIARKMNK